MAGDEMMERGESEMRPCMGAGVERRFFRINKSELPAEVKALIIREAEYNNRLNEILRKNGIVLYSLDDMGRIVRLAVEDPSAHAWCRHTANKRLQLDDGRVLWWVKIDKRLLEGQKLLAEITEVNGMSVQHRNKETALLKHFGLLFSISVNGRTYSSEAWEDGDYWYIRAPKTPKAGRVIGYGIPDEYIPDKGLEEIDGAALPKKQI